MCYNLGFILGDPSNDGHCIHETCHIVATHSVESINKAYEEFTNTYGFDFIKLFEEYECDTVFPENIKKTLEELSISGYLDGIDDFVRIFFDIIKIIIPDFEWEYRDLEETELDILRGAGYGLFRV